MASAGHSNNNVDKEIPTGNRDAFKSKCTEVEEVAHVVMHSLIDT